MADFTLDMSKFMKAMQQSPDAVERGAKVALGDIKDDWVRGAVDIAPLDKSALRQSIAGTVINPGASGIVEVESNATSDTGGKRFNYSYYIHEHDAGGKQLKTPGTVKKYLDESMEKRQADYQRWLEEEIESELKKAGW